MLVFEASPGATILERTPRRQATRLKGARGHGKGTPLFIAAENYPEQVMANMPAAAPVAAAGSWRGQQLLWSHLCVSLSGSPCPCPVCCPISSHLTLENALRSPRANDLPLQNTEAPPLPVIVFPETKLPMEIHWIWTPSPELLEIVVPSSWTLEPCCTETPDP